MGKLFSRACRTGGIGFKLRGLIQIRYKGEIFTVRVMEHWHRLLREVVDAPEVRLDGALSSLF